MPKNSKWARPKGQVLFKCLCSGLNSWPPKDIFVVVVQWPRRVWLFVTPWTAALQACLSLTISQTLNSCPLNQWCHPTISSSVALFSFCLQSFPASGCFPVICKGYVRVLTTRTCEHNLIWKRTLADFIQLMSQIEIVLDYPSGP